MGTTSLAKSAETVLAYLARIVLHYLARECWGTLGTLGPMESLK